MNDRTQGSPGDPKRWLALIVLCLGVLMIVHDTTIVNVALPSIRADLGFTETSLVWVVNAYMLTFGGFLLLGGRLRLAVLASLAAGRTEVQLASGVATQVALNEGYRLAFMVGAGFAAAAALVGATLLRVGLHANAPQGDGMQGSVA